MDILYQIPFYAVVIGIVAFFAWLAARQARLRREAIQRLADELGMSFDPGDDYSMLGGRFNRIDLLRKGKRQKTFNHLIGRVEGYDVVCCDYRYVTETTDSKGRKTTHYHYFGIVFVEVPLRMSEVRIRREGWFDKIAGALGFDDIDFESAEFSRRFHVASDDRRFAYDLIHPRAMEYLMSTDKYSWEFEGGVIALYQSGTFKIEAIRPAIMTAIGFIKHIPPHLWADRGTAA